MAVILRDVPPGYDWGWFSREDPRMHIQVVDRKHIHLNYKVWLEAPGRRVVEPAGDIPSKIFKKLRAELDFKQPSIEAEWVSLMIDLGWLRHAVRGTLVTLIAYPNTPNRFERTIDLRDYLAPEFAAQIRPQDVGLNSEYAVVELWPHRAEGNRPWIQIPPILWG